MRLFGCDHLPLAPDALNEGRLRRFLQTPGVILFCGLGAVALAQSGQVPERAGLQREPGVSAAPGSGRMAATAAPSAYLFADLPTDLPQYTLVYQTDAAAGVIRVAGGGTTRRLLMSNGPGVTPAFSPAEDYAKGKTAISGLPGLNSNSLVGLSLIQDASPNAIFISQSCSGRQADLNTGLALDGTAATDFGPCINALLSTATVAAPVALVVDGSFAVSGIYGPLAGNWSIVGLGGGMNASDKLYGTGFYQIAGTDGDVIHNGPKHQYEPGFAGRPSTRGANVTLSNFVINGNRGNGRDGDNTSGDPRRSVAGPWTFGIGLHSLDRVRVTGVYTYNIATFNTVFDDVGYGEFTNNICANTGTRGSVAQGQNADCWHIDGPANDLHSANVTCRSTDDCFALNAPESQGGTIERVSISNWTMDSRTCGRMYTNSVTAADRSGGSIPLVRDVSVSGVRCISKSWAIMFGHADSATHVLTQEASITNVRVNGSTFSTPFGFIISDTIGALTIADTTLADMTCSHDGLAQPYCGFVQFATNTVRVSHLSLVNDTLKFTPAGHAAIAGAVSTLQGWNSGTGNKIGSANIADLDIIGFRKVDVGRSYGPIGQLITTDANSKFANVVLSGNDRGSILAVTNAPAQVRLANHIAVTR